MLRRLGTITAAAVLVALGLTAPSASAATCLEHAEEVNDSTGQVTVVCVKWSDDSTTTPVDNDKGDDDDDGGGGEKPKCTFDGQTIPCTSDLGTWVGSMGCYAQPMSPQPPKSSPRWEGNDDGVILECRAPQCTGGPLAPGVCPAPDIYWAAGAPSAGPSPRQVADSAVARMQLTMGEIGSTPPSTEVRTDSMGLVGVPMWLWVANPAENTTGPITRSASGGGLTVTATATLDRIDWALTDRDTGAVRRTMTCADENAGGTPWSDERDGDGSVPSPTCGFPAALNDRAGYYTLTGTAHWVVEWAGGGQTGTITVPPQERSVPIDIGESQVLITQ
jgi:hypothetical protein